MPQVDEAVRWQAGALLQTDAERMRGLSRGYESSSNLKTALVKLAGAYSEGVGPLVLLTRTCAVFLYLKVNANPHCAEQCQIFVRCQSFSNAAVHGEKSSGHAQNLHFTQGNSEPMESIALVQSARPTRP